MSEQPKNDGKFFPEIAEKIVNDARRKAANGEQVAPFDKLKAAVSEISVTRQQALDRYAPGEADSARPDETRSVTLTTYPHHESTIDYLNSDPFSQKAPTEDKVQKVETVTFQPAKVAKRTFKDFDHNGEVTGPELEEGFRKQAPAILDETAKKFKGLAHDEICHGQSLNHPHVDAYIISEDQIDSKRSWGLGTSNANPITVVRDNKLGEAGVNAAAAQSRENRDIAYQSKLAAEAYILQECTKGAKPVEAAPGGTPLPNRAVQKPSTNEKH